ncbi:MAG: hypothetical protein AB1760_10805, partial [Pseudomonadota bacterium]
MSTRSAAAVFIRQPQDIYQTEGEIENGRYRGRWHFSYDDYHDMDYNHFGTLRAFNDNILDPG